MAKLPNAIVLRSSLGTTGFLDTAKYLKSNLDTESRRIGNSVSVTLFRAETALSAKGYWPP
jgi:hypothetical protein